MTEEKETQQPDELFRSIFESLPDGPSPNGWDKPSARVWSHIRRQIRPATLSPALKGLLTLAALAVVVVAYLQWSGVSEEPAAPREAAPIAQIVEPPAPEFAPLPAPPASALPSPAPVAPARSLPAASAAQPMPAHAAQPSAEEIEKTPELATHAPRRNDDMQAPKNTAELRRLELRKLARQAWETPLQPLPVSPKKVDVTPKN